MLAQEASLADEEIQLLGPWKSDSYQLYIDISAAYIFNALQRHQRLLHLYGGTSHRRRQPVFWFFFLGYLGASGIEVLLAFELPLGFFPAQLSF